MRLLVCLPARNIRVVLMVAAVEEATSVMKNVLDTPEPVRFLPTRH